MHVISSGFDGLDVAYRGMISDDFLTCLEQAQERAIGAREPALLEYGGVKLHVAESGARGGYAFRCDTGPIGATWFFKRPNARDAWGIRVSVKSLMLATFGLQGARERIEGALGALGCTLAARPESIGRIDFAVDVLAPGFELHPDNFVMHSRTTRADHQEVETVQSHGRSGRYTSVTVGKMPGRQVIVYDKRLEAFQKPEKRVWLEIWRRAIEQRTLLSVDFSDKFASTVWRTEMRAGKKCLKDRHDVTTWDDLAVKAPEIFRETLDRTRYSVPIADSNRSRWPEHLLWKLARDEVGAIELRRSPDIHADMIANACRDAQLEIIDSQLIGLAAARLALKHPKGNPPDLVAIATAPIYNRVSRDDPDFWDKIERARERYATYS